MKKVNFKKNFFTGVFVTLPLFATIYVLYLTYKIIASIIVLILPIDFITKILIATNSELAKKEESVTVLVSFVTIGTSIILIYIAGVYINKFFNKRTSKYIEKTIRKIPVVNSLYFIFKQIRDLVFNKKNNTYKKAVIIQYPRDGLYILGLVANDRNELAENATGNKEMYNIYVPTTPNPTTGFYVIMAKEDVIEVDYTVEEVFKLVVSAGALEPIREEEAVESENDKN